MKQNFSTFLIALILSGCAGKISVTPEKIISEQPRTIPEMNKVTVPSNIAPMNFKVMEQQEMTDVKIEGAKSGSIHLQCESLFKIPEFQWRALLKANQNDSVRITVTIKKDDKWQQFAPISFFVSNKEISCDLVYRLVAPGYESYSKTGIYQRNISDFTEKEIIINENVPLHEMQQKHCVACHTFSKRDANTLSYHIRGNQSGTIVRKAGKDSFYDLNPDETIANASFPAWHPNGKYIAYSTNKTQQNNHRLNAIRIEQNDHQSDIVVFDVNRRELFSCDKLMGTLAYETYPVFSADGKKMYFCAASPVDLPKKHKDVKYSLCSIAFDPVNGVFGDKIDTLVSASQVGKSVLYPHPSPDGNFILLTVTDYGMYPVWHKESDFAMYNIRTEEFRIMDEINSYDTDSYHSWDENSKWIVLSSRRGDGMNSRPYFTLINENGVGSKPFILPQDNPESYYDNTYFSFSMPEFVKGKVDAVDVKALDPMVTYGRKEVIKFERR